MKIGIAVNHSQVSRWHLWLAEDLKRAGNELVFVCSRQPLIPPRGITIGLQLDRLLHRAGGEHAIDRVKVECQDWSSSMTSDVLIDCTGGSLDLPPAGRILTPMFDGVASELGALSAFLDGRPLEIGVVDSRTGGYVSTGYPATDQTVCLSRMLDNVLSRAVELITQAVLEPAGRQSAAEQALLPLPQCPDLTGQMARRLAEDVARKLSNRLSAKTRKPQRWAMGLRPISGPGLIEGDWPAKAEYAIVRDDEQRFYADPTLFEHEGRTWLFCEEFPFATQKGIISVAEVNGDGTVGAMRPALELPVHLSFPFVFRREGQIWMIPESMASNGVDLYRAVEFPYRWQHERRLLDGVAACDAVLLERDRRLYLMTTESRRMSTSWDHLGVYSSGSLDEPFNPVTSGTNIIDSRLSRSAGDTLQRGSELLRLSQDCSRLYGGGMVLSRIDQLSPERFAQTEVATIRATGTPAIIGTHTYTKSTKFEAIDVWGEVDGVEKISLELQPLKSRSDNEVEAAKASSRTWVQGLPRDGRIAAGDGVAGLVSVVIPTYNRAYIVGSAIDSVIAQTYPSIEIIVIDDGSSDNTAEVIARYASLEPGREVHYVRQPNGGVCRARNTGLRMARGEFVALLDSDDAWLPWKLEAQVAVLRAQPEAGMVWTDMIAVDADGRELHQAYLRKMYSAHEKVRIEDVMHSVGQLGEACPSVPAAAASRPVFCGDIVSEMMLGNLVHTSTVLIRRKRLRSVGPFDVALRRSGEDYEFHLRTSFYGPVSFIDASTIYYRVGASDQLTAPVYQIDLARNNLATLRRWRAYGRGRIATDSARFRRHLAQAHTWLGETELELGHTRAAARHLLAGLVGDPHVRTARLLGLCAMPPTGRAAIRGLWRRAKFWTGGSRQSVGPSPGEAGHQLSPQSAPSSPQLRMELIDDEKRLRAVAPLWEELLARAERPEPMLSPDWAMAWWNHYRSGRALAVAALYRGDRLVGLAPLCRREFTYRLGIRFQRLEILGCSGGESDGVCGEYLGLLAEKGSEAEVAEAFARELSRGSFGRWDELVIELMEGNSAMARELVPRLETIGLVTSHVDMVSHYLPLTKNWDAFLQGVHGKRRNWFRRTWKDFVAWAGAEGYAIQRVAHAGDVADFMRVLAELHRERWQSDGNEGAFASSRFKAFHDEFAHKMHERGQLELCRLTVGGKAVAACYGFLAGNKIYFYQSGRKTTGIPSHVRIGIIMFILAIQDAMARGIAEWDFLGGDSRYKTHFTSLTRPLVTLRVARRGWREVVRLGVYGAGRKMKRLVRRRSTEPSANGPAPMGD